jgi:hypothetical protein
VKEDRESLSWHREYHTKRIVTSAATSVNRQRPTIVGLSVTLVADDDFKPLRSSQSCSSKNLVTIVFEAMGCRKRTTQVVMNVDKPEIMNPWAKSGNGNVCVIASRRIEKGTRCEPGARSWIQEFGRHWFEA